MDNILAQISRKKYNSNKKFVQIPISLFDQLTEMKTQLNFKSLGDVIQHLFNNFQNIQIISEDTDPKFKFCETEVFSRGKRKKDYGESDIIEKISLFKVARSLTINVIGDKWETFLKAENIILEQSDLRDTICRFFIQLKRKDGKEYKLKTYRSYCSNLLSFLNQKKLDSLIKFLKKFFFFFFFK
ncbi:hypothetical protein M0811_04650 [Anaeramoeba ignava]|uniref:Uncharacterized protein n=1 Tax=Anaeramoeba ignava TaxID=1746090 RepID=A0A9Q0RG77_ANAIG|nr:hypothetical protein M0811_04650 [Anaeramoeba ignava]